VAAYQKNLQGAALYSAITGTFGTRYVVGYQSAAMVSVVYSFHYASASAKQVASLNASGQYLSQYGNYSAYVDAFFQARAPILPRV
jgi:hypothetical protein